MSVLEVLKKHVSGIVLAFGHHPGKNREDAAYVFVGPSEEVAPGVFHFYSVANSVTFVCGDRLLQVDCQLGFKAPEVIAQMRQRTELPIDSIVITHGHVDHCLGAQLYIDDNLKRGYARPRVIGHSHLRERINKNKLLEGHRIATDKRQFQVDFDLQDLFVYPDVEFMDRMMVALSDQRFIIAFGHGHTEDSIWVYNPSARCSPVGICSSGLRPTWATRSKCSALPWRTPRLSKKWLTGGRGTVPGAPARDLRQRRNSNLSAHHGPIPAPHTESCRLLPQPQHDPGGHAQQPEDARGTDELQVAPAIYGHPVFIAIGIFKRYAGYYSGRPAELFPPAYADIGQEVVQLAGGVATVIDRARVLQTAGRLELACQLAEWAVHGEPQNKAAWETYGMLFKERAEKEVNIQARGCWNSAVRKAVAALEKLG